MNSLELARQSLAGNDPAGALKHLAGLLESQPDNADALWLCAVALFQSGQLPQSRLALVRLLERIPDQDQDLSQQYRLLGMVCSQLGDFHAAREAFNYLLGKTPDAPALLSVLARLCYAEGDRDGAGRYAADFFACLPAITAADLRDPLMEFGKTVYDCSLFATRETAPAWLDTLTTLLEGERGRQLLQDFSLHFGLAKLHETLGSFAPALAHYREGNELQRRRSAYQIENDLGIIEKTRQDYDRSWFESAQPARPREGEPQPVFILGMPRTGSSLVEQVLAAHPAVLPCGERDWLHEAFREVLTSRSREAGHVLTPAEFDQGFFEAVRTAYFRLARLPAGTTALTDKMPGNVYKLGLLLKTFPDARVVLTERDKLATVMSCFTTAFAAGQGFSERLEDCARMYDATRQLADHWVDCAPENILRLPYGDLVAEPEPVIDRLLEFCGLRPDAACYQPHKVRRAVGTSSNMQVLDPIHRNADDRWHVYLEHLGSEAALFDR